MEIPRTKTLFDSNGSLIRKKILFLKIGDFIMAVLIERKKTPRAKKVADFKPVKLPLTLETIDEVKALIGFYKSQDDSDSIVEFLESKIAAYVK
jgi:hypothetical protein